MKAKSIVGVTVLLAWLIGLSEFAPAQTYTNPIIDEIGPADPAPVVKKR